MSLKKSDIAKNIASKASISESIGKILVSSFIDVVKLKSNEQDVKIASFGTFANKVTPQRLGRNPKTGDEKEITARNVISFYPSKAIKNKIS